MTRIIKIKKGLDIPVAGAPSDRFTECRPTFAAVTPDDFPGYHWRPVVKPGEHVVAGQPVFQAKEADDISLVSPITGNVGEIARGARRHIEYLSIIPGGEDNECVNFEIPADDITDAEYRDMARALLKNSGLWARMRQRPYDIVPEAEATPRDIFVTAFDSAPCAPDILSGLDRQDIYRGIEVLRRLTDGNVWIGCRPSQASELQIVANQKARIIAFEGPHPAGNVGVQIAAIKPVSKGEVVWTLDITTLAAIGYLFNTNNLDFSTTVAVTGPMVNDPHLIKTVMGADMRTLIGRTVAEENTGLRVISGNVLTGVAVSATDGFLRYPYRQISVIEEGEHVNEFMGWASLSTKKFSVKRMLPSGLFRSRRPFSFDSRILGGHRAMILAGELDTVFPFDIYCEYLIKAIIANDIDRMEKLGIYEVAPEDFALPEFIDTSKQELQKLVREGIDRLREELS